MSIDHLEPWSFTTSCGHGLYGWRSPARGKPVLHFLHGNGFDSRVYWPMLSLLKDDYDLILSHAQGHGGSDAGDRFLGYGRNAKMLAQWLKHAKGEYGDVRWIGMGHSFGGILHTLIASRQPQLFDQLVLLDPVFMPPPLSTATRQLARLGLMKHSPMARQARARRTQWADRDDALAYFRERGVFRGWHPQALDAYLDYSLDHRDSYITLQTPAWLEAQIFSQHSYRLWPAISALQGHVDILYGADSFSFIKPAVERAARRSNIHAHRVPGGHCFMQQFPEDTAKRCRQLIGTGV